MVQWHYMISYNLSLCVLVVVVGQMTLNDQKSSIMTCSVGV
jgi:hypothetical protein